jgi:hypothetical protein
VSLGRFNWLDHVIDNQEFTYVLHSLNNWQNVERIWMWSFFKIRYFFCPSSPWSGAIPLKTFLHVHQILKEVEHLWSSEELPTQKIYNVKIEKKVWHPSQIILHYSPQITVVLHCCSTVQRVWRGHLISLILGENQNGGDGEWRKPTE